MTPKKSESASNEMRIKKIKAGTVIDHITAGYALAVMQILGITGREGDVISIGMNVQSKRMQKKDIIKIEGREITTEEINRIAMIAPKATINIIRGFKLHQKTRISIPDEIVGIVQCQNPSCITNNERGVHSSFKVVDRTPVTLRCMYCKRITGHEDIVQQLLGED